MNFFSGTKEIPLNPLLMYTSPFLKFSPFLPENSDPPFRVFSSGRDAARGGPRGSPHPKISKSLHGSQNLHHLNDHWVGGPPMKIFHSPTCRREAPKFFLQILQIFQFSIPNLGQIVKFSALCAQSLTKFQEKFTKNAKWWHILPNLSMSPIIPCPSHHCPPS